MARTRRGSQPTTTPTTAGASWRQPAAVAYRDPRSSPLRLRPHGAARTPPSYRGTSRTCKRVAGSRRPFVPCAPTTLWKGSAWWRRRPTAHDRRSELRGLGRVGVPSEGYALREAGGGCGGYGLQRLQRFDVRDTTCPAYSGGPLRRRSTERRWDDRHAQEPDDQRAGRQQLPRPMLAMHAST